MRLAVSTSKGFRWIRLRGLPFRHWIAGRAATVRERPATNISRDGRSLTVAARLSRLSGDERGTALIEFILVMYPFLFLLMGVVQMAMLAMGALYVNYANFMALRTASVWYEPKEYGYIGDTEYDLRCKTAAMMALGPLERYAWVQNDAASQAEVLTRLSFDSSVDGGDANLLKGKLSYDFYLWVPFAGRVISGLMKNGVPAGESTRDVIAGESETPLNATPILTLRSRNDFADDGYHRVVIQRRWKYPTS